MNSVVVPADTTACPKIPFHNARASPPFMALLALPDSGSVAAALAATPDLLHFFFTMPSQTAITAQGFAAKPRLTGHPLGLPLEQALAGR